MNAYIDIVMTQSCTGTPWMCLGGKEMIILDLGIRWGLVASVTTRPTSTPGTNWRIGWVGARSDLDTEARGKFFASAKDRTPVVQSVVRHYTD
jgi:hypothetical protein